MSDRTVLVNARLGLAGRPASILIEHGSIVSVDRDSTHPSSDSRTAVVDVGGRTVLPGFWDSHLHSLQWASARRRVNLRDARSPQHAAAIMREAAVSQRFRDGEVLVGYGFQDGLWSEKPDAAMLDVACPANPVVLISNDLHASWLNTRALQIAGAPPSTGLLVEEDGRRAVEALVSNEPDAADEWVIDAVRSAAARGVVGITDFEVANNVEAWRRRAARWRLPVKVECAIYPQDLDGAIASGLRTGARIDICGNHLEVGHLKIFVDGSLNTRTAYCNHPYPGLDGDGAFGQLRTSGDELRELLRRSVPNGIHPAVHAIGDRAATIALDAFEEFGCPGRIEHAQLIDESDFERVSMPGLVLGVQPAHLWDDRDVAERHWAGRTAGAFAYGALIRAGGVLELGSDAPVAPMDPWVSIAAAVHRSADERPPWHPDNALTLEEALTAASRGRSRVEVGMPADLVITDRNPLEVPPSELATIEVAATLTGGRWTHNTLG